MTKQGPPYHAALVRISDMCRYAAHASRRDCYIRFKTIVRITNTPANHLVARANLASKLFDLFFVKKVSDPPLNAPDNPDVLPDWNIMIAISATHTTR